MNEPLIRAPPSTTHSTPTAGPPSLTSSSAITSASEHKGAPIPAEGPHVPIPTQQGPRLEPLARAIRPHVKSSPAFSAEGVEAAAASMKRHQLAQQQQQYQRQLGVDNVERVDTSANTLHRVGQIVGVSVVMLVLAARGLLLVARLMSMN